MKGSPGRASEATQPHHIQDRVCDDIAFLAHSPPNRPALATRAMSEEESFTLCPLARSAQRGLKVPAGTHGYSSRRGLPPTTAFSPGAPLGSV
ncbi:unnamed protein product [Gadus morhua 'NCC']